MLVVGLDDSELRRIASELDVDDVLSAALPDLAARLRTCPDAFDAGALVLDVAADDDAGPHRWSIVRRDGTPVAEPGIVTPSAAELAVTFPALLQLLAGVLTFDAAVATGRLVPRGDTNIAALVGPHFAEGRRVVASAAHPPTDRASAS